MVVIYLISTVGDVIVTVDCCTMKVAGLVVMKSKYTQL